MVSTKLRVNCSNCEQTCNITLKQQQSVGEKIMYSGSASCGQCGMNMDIQTTLYAGSPEIR